MFNIRFMRGTTVLLLAGLLALAAQARQGLLLAGGAGYRKPVLELVELFARESGIRAETSFGNMRQAETQARQNPDVALVVGDEAFLAPMGLFERYQLLGDGRLVLVAARGVALAALEELKEARFRRIGVPDRRQAVYGRAAFTCMRRQGLLDELTPRLLEVATVPQVGAYVGTGEVDAGFVNNTEAQALRGRAGAMLELPTSCHEPIRLSVGVVRGHADAPAVRAFLEFVQSPAARAALQRHGL